MGWGSEFTVGFRVVGLGNAMGFRFEVLGLRV